MFNVEPTYLNSFSHNIQYLSKTDGTKDIRIYLLLRDDLIMTADRQICLCIDTIHNVKKSLFRDDYKDRPFKCLEVKSTYF